VKNLQSDGMLLTQDQQEQTAEEKEKKITNLIQHIS
jgi:hypothetical protein